MPHTSLEDCCCVEELHCDGNLHGRLAQLIKLLGFKGRGYGTLKRRGALENTWGCHGA